MGSALGLFATGSRGAAVIGTGESRADHIGFGGRGVGGVAAVRRRGDARPRRHRAGRCGSDGWRRFDAAGDPLLVLARDRRRRPVQPGVDVLEKPRRPQAHGALEARVGIEQVDRYGQHRGDRQAGGEPDRGNDGPADEPKRRSDKPQGIEDRPQAEHDHQRGEGLSHFGEGFAERAHGIADGRLARVFGEFFSASGTACSARVCRSIFLIVRSRASFSSSTMGSGNRMSWRCRCTTPRAWA